MENYSILREAALGMLFKGYLHNLRGPVQAMLMQIELFEARLRNLELGKEALEVITQLCDRLKKQVYRQIDLLAAAETEMENTSEGPWDLREALRKELVFWEAELSFKHKVEKEFEEGPEVRVKMPLNRLRAGLCALFFTIIFLLAEKEGRLKLSVEPSVEGPRVVLQVEPEVIDPENSYLQAAREIFSPEADLQASPSEIRLLFKGRVRP